MPKKEQRSQTQKPTAEVTAYIHAAYQEFRQQTSHYAALIKEHLSIEARIELHEKMLCLTRDHLASILLQANAENTIVKSDWRPTFEAVRFVGVRLVDACMTLLQEHKKLTPQQLLEALNDGMFRFRTRSPQREIHAAMLQQRRAKKVGDTWVWSGGGEQISMRLRVAKPQTAAQPLIMATGTESGS